MNNNLTTIYVVRHGESEGGIGITQKNTSKFESPLTLNGIIQAKEIAEKLKNVGFAAVFSSKLLRARQTAKIIKLQKNIIIKSVEAINERNSSDYAKKIGKAEDEIFEEMKIDLSKLQDEKKLSYKHSSQMESAGESAIRLITFLREIAIAHKGQNLLVVSHGNLMRNVLTHLGFVKYDDLPHGAITNTGYFVLESNGIEFFLKEMIGINIQKGKTRIW